jgi:6-phosphogluconolactonase
VYFLCRRILVQQLHLEF